MRRLVIYAHYDTQPVVKGYVKYMLRALRPTAERLIFVSTASLGEAYVVDVKTVVDEVRQIPNFGYDVEMYRTTLNAVSAADYDELVLVNSSTLGPVGDLGALMDRMSADPCDFWGMTDGTELGWNLQGYFLVYKQRVCASPAFASFWANAVPLENKLEIIHRYEHGLTANMCAGGFKAGVVVSCYALGMLNINTTNYATERLLSLGMPLVKIARMRWCDEVAVRVRQQMSNAGYSAGMIDEAVPELIGRVS